MQAFAFSALLAALLVGPVAAANEVSLVVTIHPLALLLEEIGAERVRVHVLVPPGASPHGFEPRPSDLVRIARADACLNLGGGLDDWAGRLFAMARAPEQHARTSSLLGLLGRTDEAAEAEPRSRAHRHGSPGPHGDDPHIWLDPIAVRDEIVPVLAAFLTALDPAGRAHYQDRARQFRSQLGALDREIRRLLRGESRSEPLGYVAFHNAWRHFAARYGLHEIAVVQEAAGEEPTPRELGTLVRRARRAQLRAILVEPQLDPRLARTTSEEFGGKTVLVDPLGDPEDPERSTYRGLLRFNARAFRRATSPRTEEAR